jgi:2-dehydropantoate 2-reductase
MRYLVVGAGAVGGYLGGRLALSGQPVAFVVRPAQADALRQSGLTLLEGDHVFPLPGLRLESDLASACAAFDPQAILLAVKAYALDSVIADLQRVAAPLPPLVCLLNGIGNEEQLAQAFGPEQTIAASLTTAVQVATTGSIQVEKARGLGLHAAHLLTPALLAEFHQAGLSPRAYNRADSMKWSKLLTNLVSNATSAIVHWTPAQVYAHKGLFRLEIEALRETVRVMQRKRIPVVDLPGVPTAWFARVVGWPPVLSRPLLARVVASGRGDKLPSFVQDLARRRSEVEWLNGAVARQAETVGLAAPANRVLFEVLMALVRGVEDPLIYRQRPERLLQRAAAGGVPGVTGYNPAG